MARELQDLTDQELLSLKSGDYSGVDLRSLSDNALLVLKNRRSRVAKTQPINSQIPEYMRPQTPQSFGDMVPEVSRQQIADYVKSPEYRAQKTVQGIKGYDLGRLGDKGVIKDEGLPTSLIQAIGAGTSTIGMPPVYARRSSSGDIVAPSGETFSQTTEQSGNVLKTHRKIGATPLMAELAGGIGAYATVFGTAMSLLRGIPVVAQLAKVAPALTEIGINTAAGGATGGAIEGIKGVTGQKTDLSQIWKQAVFAGGAQAAISGITSAYAKYAGARAAKKLAQELAAANEQERLAIVKRTQDWLESQPKQLPYRGSPSENALAAPLTKEQSRYGMAVYQLQRGKITADQFKEIAATTSKEDADHVMNVLRSQGANTPSQSNAPTTVTNPPLPGQRLDQALNATPDNVFEGTPLVANEIGPGNNQWAIDKLTGVGEQSRFKEGVARPGQLNKPSGNKPKEIIASPQSEPIPKDWYAKPTTTTRPKPLKYPLPDIESATDQQLRDEALILLGHERASEIAAMSRENLQYYISRGELGSIEKTQSSLRGGQVSSTSPQSPITGGTYNPESPITPVGGRETGYARDNGGITAHSLGGSLLGFKQDENGNITYDPLRGAIGAGVGAAGLVFGSKLKSGSSALGAKPTTIEPPSMLKRLGMTFVKGELPSLMNRPVHLLEKFASTPFSQEVASTMAGVQQRMRTLAGNSIAGFEEVVRPFSGIKNIFGDHVSRTWLKNNGLKAMESVDVKAPTEAAKKVVEYSKKSFSEWAQLIKSVNPKFNERLLYVPHTLTDEARTALERGNGALYDALNAWANKAGVEIDFLLNRGFDKFMTKRYGSLDFKRLADLPPTINVGGKAIKVLETDLMKLYPQYVDNAARRVAIMEKFGAAPEDAAQKANEIFNDLRREQGEQAASAFQDMWQEANGFTVGREVTGSTAYRMLVNAPSSFIRPMLLSVSAPMNIVQIPYTAVLSGGRNLTKGIIDAFKPEVLGDLRRSGAFARDVLGDLYYTQGLTGIPEKINRTLMKVEGHGLLNKPVNIIASRAAEHNLYDAIEIIKGGEKNGTVLRRLWGLTPQQLKDQLRFTHQFSESDISRMVKDGVSPADVDRVRQQGPELINLYHESGLNRPRWLSKPLWREVTRYTQFTRGIGNAASYAVRQTKSGNIKPLLYFAGAQEISYRFGHAIHQALYDRASEDDQWWEKLTNRLLDTGTLGLGGVVFNMIQDAAKFGKNPTQLPMPNVDAVLNAYRVSTKKGVDKGIQQLFGAYRAFRSIQGRATKDIQYYADRLDQNLYTTSGLNAEGKPHTAFDPSKEYNTQTSKMLIERAKQQGIWGKVQMELVLRSMRRNIEAGDKKLEGFKQYLDDLDANAPDYKEDTTEQ